MAKKQLILAAVSTAVTVSLDMAQAQAGEGDVVVVVGRYDDGGTVMSEHSDPESTCLGAWVGPITVSVDGTESTLDLKTFGGATFHRHGSWDHLQGGELHSNPDFPPARITVGDDWVEGDWVWSFKQFDNWAEFQESVRFEVIGGEWSGRAVVGGHFALTHYADWSSSSEEDLGGGCRRTVNAHLTRGTVAGHVILGD